MQTRGGLEMAEFEISHGRCGAICRVETLDFKGANFIIIKDHLGGVPWVRASGRVVPGVTYAHA